MLKYNTLRLTAAGALYWSALLSPATSGAATFLLSDLTNWIGPAAGPGISQAALVIQWPGQTAWAWGFRWESSQAKTGQDFLLALAGADPRFTFTGNIFVSNLKWDSDLNGTPEFSFPGYNPSTFEFLSYWVNNDQQLNNYNDGAAPDGAHILPPLGSPYDEAGPGRWVASNTGVQGRPLVDGAWDGWNYSTGDGTLLPALPINAPALIPEPSGALLLVLAGSLLVRRRR
jgi:hypothetical protein